MDPHETGESGSGRPRRSPYDQLPRWRLRLGIISFAFGVVAVVFLVTTGEATPWGTLGAMINIILGLISAISGWRDLREAAGPRGDQPPV